MKMSMCVREFLGGSNMIMCVLRQLPTFIMRRQFDFDLRGSDFSMHCHSVATVVVVRRCETFADFTERTMVTKHCV